MKPNKTGEPCQRCSEPTPLAIGMHPGRQTPLCGPCTLAWFKVRDEAVVVLFDKFLVKKGKA